MNDATGKVPKPTASHLHTVNLVVALLAGVISITGGIYSLKNNLFSGPAYGSLQGIVRDERIARPLKLVAVEVADLAGAVVNTASTDDDGRYAIESLKTGNYLVKFTAPLHKVETKTVKIEKDLMSSINADLVPEAQPANLSPVEFPVTARQTMPSPYAEPGMYSPANAASGYVSSQNIPASTTVPGYAQQEPDRHAAYSGVSDSAYHRHPRRRYSDPSMNTASGGSQNPSGGPALAQAGAQLLQAWLSSNKTDLPSAATSTSIVPSSSQTTESQ